MTNLDAVGRRRSRTFVGMLTALATITVANPGAMAAAVTLSSRDNIQAEVEAHPPATTFVLGPGIYREASVTSLKDGDSFVGRSGAIMDGARQLTGWARVSIGDREYWTAEGGISLVSHRCG